MKHKLILFLSLVLIISCKRFYSLDSFLFEPEKTDEYLRPADLYEYNARLIIPDSLIQPVTLTSMGNKIYGFFVKGYPDSVANNQVTILYCHGNSVNINRYWVRVEYLWEMGYNVFIFDYQGYGKSEGSPSGEALYSDGHQALTYLKSRSDIDTTKIVYYGWSLGSYVATYLASDIWHPGALILESAPASIKALLKDSGLLELDGSYVAEADFDNEKRISKIRCPLLMMHGKADDFVVFERHALLIWNKAVEPKENLWIDGATHDNIPEVLGDLYYKKTIDFIKRHILD